MTVTETVAWLGVFSLLGFGVHSCKEWNMADSKEANIRRLEEVRNIEAERIREHARQMECIKKNMYCGLPPTK